MANRRSVRPEVVVAGDPGRASHIAGMLMRQDVPVASYVPDYAGGGSGLGIGALASSARVIVETLDYPVDAKRALLEEIAEAMRPGTLLISSALAMTAVEISITLGGYSRLVAFGLLDTEAPHRMLELAVPSETASDVLSQASEFWAGLGYRSRTVADTPAMTTPRIVCCIVNEAAWALGEGVASPEDIDTAMRLGARHPEGPLRRGDRIGLHRVAAVLQNLEDYYGEERYRPAPELRRLILTGRMGVEYGSGFYDYTASVADHNGDVTS